MYVNLAIAHDIGNGPNRFQVGVRATNLLGDFSPTVVGQTSRYINNGLGGYNGVAGCVNYNACGNGLHPVRLERGQPLVSTAPIPALTPALRE